jgi:hypothetical protein
MRRLWKRSVRRHYGRLCTVCVLIWTLIFPPTLFAPQRALAAFVKAPSEHFPTTPLPPIALPLATSMAMVIPM